MATTVRILVEEGRKRVFVRALDWPGWCRSGKTPELAMDNLLEHAPRYAVVAKGAGARFPAAPQLEVADRLPGDATTEFGAMSVVAGADRVPLTGRELARWIALLQASWAELDAMAARSAEHLAKGPRGGGRDRTKMLQHALDAERSYAAKIGARTNPAAGSDAPAVAANRAAVVAALHAADGTTRWPACDFVHRAAWHALDHVWEMEDKQPQ